jgi:hypothetical protein
MSGYVQQEQHAVRGTAARRHRLRMSLFCHSQFALTTLRRRLRYACAAKKCGLLHSTFTLRATANVLVSIIQGNIPGQS